MASREYFAEVPSTQELADERARAGAPAGTRIVAGAQSAGRGRGARSWHSPAGGLYLSVVVGRPPLHAGLFSLAVGAHLSEAIGERWELPLAVKWPNDLYVTGGARTVRKLGGVLVDRVTDPTGGPVLVVGVGLNVRAPPDGWPHVGRVAPVALDEVVDGIVGTAALEELAVEAIGRARRVLDEADGPHRVLALCRSRLYGLGARVLWDGRPAGRLLGLAADGALRLDADGIVVEVRSGDVAVVEGVA